MLDGLIELARPEASDADQDCGAEEQARGSGLGGRAERYRSGIRRLARILAQETEAAGPPVRVQTRVRAAEICRVGKRPGTDARAAAGDYSEIQFVVRPRCAVRRGAVGLSVKGEPVNNLAWQLRSVEIEL